MQTRKYKTAFWAQKVTGTFEKQAPGTKTAFPSNSPLPLRFCELPDSTVSCVSSGFYLPQCQSLGIIIVVCLSICLFACLYVCHSLFLTLTAVVFITDKPFSF